MLKIYMMKTYFCNLKGTDSHVDIRRGINPFGPG